jgi:hypothetical protein
LNIAVRDVVIDEVPVTSQVRLVFT